MEVGRPPDQGNEWMKRFGEKSGLGRAFLTCKVLCFVLIVGMESEFRD